MPHTPNNDVVDTRKTAPPSNNPSHTNIFMRLKESLPNALRMPIVFVLSVKLWLIKLTSSKAENAAKTILKTEAIFVNITTFASRPYRLVTAGAAAVGLVSGAIARWVVPSRGIPQVIAAGGAAHVIGSMLIKTVGLYQYYGIAVLVRIPLYVLVATIEIALLIYLFKQKSFHKLIDTL